jgi:hypothetical protein
LPEEGRRVSAPAIVIRLEFEAAPKVLADFPHEDDELRVLLWIDAHSELLEILHCALQAQERRVA